MEGCLDPSAERDHRPVVSAPADDLDPERQIAVRNGLRNMHERSVEQRPHAVHRGVAGEIVAAGCGSGGARRQDRVEAGRQGIEALA